MKNILKNNTFIALITGLILALITFPYYDLTYQTGIDPPLKWVFTDLAINGFEKAQHLSFPHGPLAFLMYPLPETLWFTAITTILLKTSLVFLISRLYSKMCFLRWVHILLSAYFIFVLASFNQLIIACVLTSYLVFYKTENASYKMFGFLLTAIALFIKSYVAILTGMITTVFIIYYIWKKREYLLSLFDIFILGSLFISIWLFLFGSFTGFFDYFYSMLQLAQDNSSAAAYYPLNSWWYLAPFLMIIGIIPFVQKSKRALFFGLLVLPSLFGAWKHGMAREDIFHVNGLFTYVAVVYLLYLLFERTKRFYNALFLGVALFLFSLNMPAAKNYVPTDYNWFGLKNISLLTSDVNQPVLKENILPSEIRKKIGNSTCDVYPWDYTIVAENNLNWQPRPVIHSYAAYTPWLDQKDANHFKSKNKPKYIIWELDKIGGDINGSSMHSIDGRYLLNNEPFTMIELLRSYQAVFRDHKFLVLEKRKQPTTSKSNSISSVKSKMNKWIPVPSSSSGLLTAKIKFDKGLLQKIKSFAYKDDQYWIHMYLQNGQVHRYRFVPKNAVNGLWITPYIHNLDSKVIDVDSIKIINSNPTIIDENIELEWEQTTFGETEISSSFFMSKINRLYSNAFKLKNGFDGNVDYWDYDFSKIRRANQNSFYTSKEQFCCPFTFPLPDSINSDKYDVWVQLNIKSDDDLKDVQLVMSSGEGKDAFWNTSYLTHQIISFGEWNSVVSTNEVILDSKNKTLKVYVFNPSQQTISIDDIEIIVRKVE